VVETALRVDAGGPAVLRQESDDALRQGGIARRGVCDVVQLRVEAAEVVDGLGAGRP
jgi:hypothetical protein